MCAVHLKLQFTRMWPSTVQMGQVATSTREDQEVWEQQGLRKTLKPYKMRSKIRAQRNGLDLSSVINRITRLDLRFHPFQMTLHHQLLAGDYQQRERFCQGLLNRPAWFALNASVNTHNIQEYCTHGQQPIDFEYQGHDRHKVAVWVDWQWNYHWSFLLSA